MKKNILAAQCGIRTPFAMPVNASTSRYELSKLDPNNASIGATRDRGGVSVGTAWSPPV